MAFWGIEVKPGKPFTHKFDDSKGRLHVSMASLGLGTATMKSVLQCNVGNKSPVFLCSLYPEKSESLQLNLEFEEVDEVIFSVIGPRSIHLSGYYLGGGRFRSLNEESESYGEDIADTDTQRSGYSYEDEYDDSFINDDEPEVFPPSPVPSDGEESSEDKKPQNRKGNRKRRLRKAYQLSETEDEGCSRQKKNANGSSAVPILASEDEDIFPISAYLKNGSNARKGIQNGGERADRVMDEISKKSKEDVVNCNTESKRNTGDSATDGQPIRNSDLQVDPLPISEEDHKDNVTPIKKKRKERSESEKVKRDKTQKSEAKVHRSVQDQKMPNITDHTEIVHETDERPKKRKRKEPKDEKKEFDVESSHPMSDVKENIDEHNEAREEKESEKKKVKKKKKKCEKAQENGEAVNKETPQYLVEENTTSAMDVEFKTADATASQVRALQNGLVIEMLESGKPDGSVAISGKKISVRYVGKLKKSGQVIDSSIDLHLFKFRLGGRKVIEGWEVGLEGMRVGEKRRLTVPPTMGYGSEGDGKNIPPDSWLVYEVELVKVR